MLPSPSSFFFFFNIDRPLKEFNLSLDTNFIRVAPGTPSY